MRSVNVVAMKKAEHRFIFLYDDDSIPETIETFGRFARDEELDFTWKDAMVLVERVKTMGAW